MFAAQQCGIEKVYKLGGAQAIAAMAFGTDTIPSVYKIFVHMCKSIEKKNFFFQKYKATFFNVSIFQKVIPVMILFRMTRFLVMKSSLTKKKENPLLRPKIDS